MAAKQPPLDHRPTSDTLQHGENDPTEPQSETKNEDTSDVEEAVRKPEVTPTHEVTAPNKAASTGKSHTLPDILLLLGISIMLIWPWMFFGIVWAKKGLQMNNHVAQLVKEHPHATTYFITLICSIISMIVTAFFSLAIIRFAQELVTYRTPTRPFHLSVLLAFRHQTWPWGKSLRDVKYLMNKDRWWLAALVVVCVVTFPQLVSSTTSLLTPGPFNRTAILTGTELNFSSTEPDCLAWFKAKPRSNDCDWQLYNGMEYTSCLGENQMVDVLEAGRGSILELLSNNSQSLAFSQLGARDGLHVLGSIRGVLPIGPDGVPAFDTLNPSPLSNADIKAGINSYNYTLAHQGLAVNVSCSYAPTCNVEVRALVPNSTVALDYSANCTQLGGSEVSPDATPLRSVNGNSTLVYWPCQAGKETQVPSYSIYMCGRNFYKTPIGNMTCTVSPQTAIFPVMYQSTSGIFSAHEPSAYSPIAVSTVISDSLVGLGGVISEGQSFQANLVAESVITFAVKSFGQEPYQTSPQYLRIFEQMIQGILEYEATYIRLIYATDPNVPSSCIRTVTGSLSYEVRGWFVASDNIGFLFPITIINLAAFVVLLLAIITAKAGGYLHHPFHPRPITRHEDIDPEEQVPDEWKDKVTFHPTSILKEHFSSHVKGTAMQGVKRAATAGVDQVVTDTIK